MTQDINDVTNSPVLCNRVYQSNPLIVARKNFDLIGMKLFLLGLQGLNPRFSIRDKVFDKDFKEFLVPAAKLKEIFGNNWYLHEVNAACKKLFDSTIEINHPRNGVTELSHLFRRLEYVPSEGLYIWFDDILRPYVLDLLDTKGFTQVDGPSLLKLSSPYAIRLLEVMLQYRNFEKFKIRREITRTLKVSELRFMLNVPEGAYQGRLNNFKKFVLENPMREINERTNYKLSFQAIKSGRQVVAFEFKLDTKMVPGAEKNERRSPLVHDAIRALQSLGFTEKVAFAIFGKCIDTDDCFSRINRAQALLDRAKTPIMNRAGFLRKAIEEDWRLYGDKYRPRRTPSRPSKTARTGKSASSIYENPEEDFSNRSESPEENSSTTSERSIRASSTKSLAQVFAPLVEALRKNLQNKRPPQQEEEHEFYERPAPTNKYNIPDETVEEIKEWITLNRSPQTVVDVLDGYGLTVERFRREFMTQQKSPLVE